MKQPITLHLPTLDALPQAAQQLLDYMGDTRILTLEGTLGAGKTTFVAALCHQLGITDGVSSPTFSIVNEYHGSALSLLHIDLYRLESLQEALDIGIEDYLYSGQYCCIEWPALIDTLLADVKRVHVHITAQGDQSRTLVATHIG